MSAAVKTAERFTALEERCAALEERADALKDLLARALDTLAQVGAAVQPLAMEVQRAHTRLDAAAMAFRKLAPPPVPVEQRLSRADWDRALADLRDEAAEQGSQQTFFSRAEVVARHRVLEAMIANREKAAS